LKAKVGSIQAEWQVKEESFTLNKGDISTKKEFGNFQVYIEWISPDQVAGTS